MANDLTTSLLALAMDAREIDGVIDRLARINEENPSDALYHVIALLKNALRELEQLC